ncbi:MAG: hypothetical protein P8X96_18780 [Desulfobacteraceae bacterium]
MNSCTPALDCPDIAADHSRFIPPAPLPQWHIIMGRARWLITPHTSDAEVNLDADPTRWLGPAKALLWIAVSIGVGLLIAGLNGS